MSDKDKWQLPQNDKVNPPMFLGDKERNLVKSLNDELSEHIMNQMILYYPVDLKTTHFHDIYGESLNKNFLPPIQVYVIIEWQGEETTLDEFYLDRRPKIQVFFPHRRITEDKEIMVREGDFIVYAGSGYEIVKINKDKELFGVHKDQVEVVATCVKARLDRFDAMGELREDN